jgi:hypothetical protein
MKIPSFPQFTPVSLELKDEMHPRLSLTPDGVSEFTFAGLYLFRERYQYQISKLEDKTLIVSGVQPIRKNESTPDGANAANRFFMTPCAAAGRGILEALFKTHDYWKNISESALINKRTQLEQWGVQFQEDRNNFDYLYLRSDLAELPGKKYHKKRNLISQFTKLYKYEKKLLTAELVPDALRVLEKWRAGKESETESDYAECKDALECFVQLNMKGLLVYIDGEPAGWCMGEPIARGRIFTIHFEKGLEMYKGIYQFLNQAFAATLPEYFTHINREQDLGDDGLRQAKMTYRPSGFVRKYTGRRVYEHEQKGESVL